ncbi:conserved hypothetical protein [Marinobacter salarius]|nr:conserved hypothetical protein [Marinobacter salarius]VXB06514.1 conserved hypothetical protein [Marinobacter salarius]
MESLSPTGVLLQPAVKLVGEFLAVGLAEGRRATGDLASIAHFFHEVAHGQALANILFGESLAARVEHVRAFFDGFGSQGDVLGDHQIACLHLVNDVVVGHVETLGYLPAFDVRARGQVNGVVGDEGGIDLPAGGGAAEDFPNGHGAGVGVDPDWHVWFLCWFGAW